MGFRFRRSIKVLPGVRLNISKTGVTSVSIGGKGLTVNRSRKGTRVTTSIPGSGLSFSKQYSDHANSPSPSGSSDHLPKTSTLKDHSVKPGWYIFFGIVIGILIMLVLKFTL